MNIFSVIFTFLLSFLPVAQSWALPAGSWCCFGSNEPETVTSEAHAGNYLGEPIAQWIVSYRNRIAIYRREASGTVPRRRNRSELPPPQVEQYRLTLSQLRLSDHVGYFLLQQYAYQDNNINVIWVPRLSVSDWVQRWQANEANSRRILHELRFEWQLVYHPETGNEMPVMPIGGSSNDVSSYTFTSRYFRPSRSNPSSQITGAGNRTVQYSNYAFSLDNKEPHKRRARVRTKVTIQYWEK